MTTLPLIATILQIDRMYLALTNSIEYNCSWLPEDQIVIKLLKLTALLPDN